MASARRLTKNAVDRLKPGQTAWDSDVRGFCVRKQRRDAVYALKYRAGGSNASTPSASTALPGLLRRHATKPRDFGARYPRARTRRCYARR
jgi:hypothetical protein